MKLIKLIKGRFSVLIASLLVLSVILTPTAFAQKYTDILSTDPYKYPIIPGSVEWKEFTSLQQKIDACQIPENILKNMSTKALVETVLNYPLLPNYRAYDDLQDGFASISSYFNGLKELYTRKDAGTELLTKFQTMDPTAFKSEWTDLEKGLYAVKFQDIEMLLSQDPIQDTLTNTQAEELVTENAIKNQVMWNNPSVFGKLCTVISSSLTERVSSRQYSYRGTPTTVYTPRGTGVPATQQNPAVHPAGDEFTAGEIATLDYQMGLLYPYAIRQRSATNMYICHTYAWYSQAPSTIVIVNPNQSAFWLDGSYFQVTMPSVGLRVRYNGADHSAIIYSTVNHTYISKWAYCGVYIHNPTDCPWYWAGSYTYFARS